MAELNDLRKTNDRMADKHKKLAAYRQRTKPVLLLRLGLRNGWIS
jgi:hypothetical protein